MKRFFDNIKRNYKYMNYSAVSELKTEVASSILGWVWWILEPLCFMLIYVFIAQVIFNSSEPFFEVFVFTALLVWNFFSKNLVTSVKLVKANSDIVTKVYIAKYILLLNKMIVNFFKLLISLGLVFVFMIIFSVPFHFSILYILIHLAVLFIVTFGCSVIMMHFGVFIEDLSNVTNIILKLVFYLSGIFFSIPHRIGASHPMWGEILLYLNPAAFLINESRNALIYNTPPTWLFTGVWLVVGLCLSAIGIALVHKYENTYVKVMK